MSDIRFEQPEGLDPNLRALEEAKRAAAQPASDSDTPLQASRQTTDLSPTPMETLNPRERIAQIQLASAEAMAARVRDAATPAEAAQWQRNVDGIASLIVQDETRREERQYEAWWERRLTYLNLAVGCGAVIGGAVLCCVGHPIAGAPVIGGGLDLIKQTLGRPKKGKK